MVEELIEDIADLVWIIFESFGYLIDSVEVGSFGLLAFYLFVFAFFQHGMNFCP